MLLCTSFNALLVLTYKTTFSVCLGKLENRKRQGEYQSTIGNKLNSRLFNGTVISYRVGLLPKVFDLSLLVLK